MRSQAKTSDTVFPKVHGIDRVMEPNVRPEKQIIKPVLHHNHMFPLTQKINIMLNQE